MAERMVKVTVQLEEETHARLKRLSDRTRVPAAQYIREGIGLVLRHAETQMANIEKALEKNDGKSSD